MHIRFTTVVVALATSLSISSVVCGAQMQTAAPRPQRAAVQRDVPAEFEAAISKMQSAKSSLEKAGDKWGGHRVRAIRLIDHALRVVGQPPTPSQTETESGPKDEPAELQDGIAALQSAESDFEQSGNQWGGRREKAMSLINEALKELQLGIDYAQSHGTY